MKYRTQAGDMLDSLCHRHYPDIAPAKTLPHVLVANPGLAVQPPVLPAGLTLILPDLPRPEPEAAIEIWS